jgi:hypothetical protein
MPHRCGMDTPPAKTQYSPECGSIRREGPVDVTESGPKIGWMGRESLTSDRRLRDPIRWGISCTNCPALACSPGCWARSS